MKGAPMTDQPVEPLSAEDGLRAALNEVAESWAIDDVIRDRMPEFLNEMARAALATTGQREPRDADPGALSDYQRGYVDGFDAPANVAARAADPGGLPDENFLAWLLAFGTEPTGYWYGSMDARQYAALMLASYHESPGAYPKRRQHRNPRASEG